MAQVEFWKKDCLIISTPMIIILFLVLIANLNKNQEIKEKPY